MTQRQRSDIRLIWCNGHPLCERALSAQIDRSRVPADKINGTVLPKVVRPYRPATEVAQPNRTLTPLRGQ
jgi:hypothetical protein